MVSESYPAIRHVAKGINFKQSLVVLAPPVKWTGFSLKWMGATMCGFPTWSTTLHSTTWCLMIMAIGGFLKWGYPKIARWWLFHGKSYEQVDDLGVPLFSETSIWLEVPISTWFIMVWSHQNLPHVENQEPIFWFFEAKTSTRYS